MGQIGRKMANGRLLFQALEPCNSQLDLSSTLALGDNKDILLIVGFNYNMSVRLSNLVCTYSWGILNS